MCAPHRSDDVGYRGSVHMGDQSKCDVLSVGGRVSCFQFECGDLKVCEQSKCEKEVLSFIERVS